MTIAPFSVAPREQSRQPLRARAAESEPASGRGTAKRTRATNERRATDTRDSHDRASKAAHCALGFTELMDLLAVHGHGCEVPIPVAIETAKGLLVANLRAAGVSVYAINPLSVARYRDRYAPSRSKSDAADALLLANIVRTDPTVHRLIPRDSELAASIRVLARAHQDAIWDRQQTVG